MCLSALNVFLIQLRVRSCSSSSWSVWEKQETFPLYVSVIFVHIRSDRTLLPFNIYILQFIIVYNIVEFQVVYIFKRINYKSLSRDQIYDQICFRDFFLSTSILKS